MSGSRQRDQLGTSLHPSCGGGGKPVMTNAAGLSRRCILAAPVILGLASAACVQETKRMKHANILVAYLTRSGNTQVIAGTLQRALDADLFEIRPARPYPEDYEEHVAQARRERDSGFEPPLGETVSNIAGYDEIYLGFPVWGETMPPPVRTFLKTHDLRRKTVRPFITHGGYGIMHPALGSRTRW